MSNTLKKHPIVVLNIILGIILAAGPFWLFPVCDRVMKNGKHMMCFYSGKFIIGMAIAIIIINLIAMKSTKKIIAVIINLATLVLAALCYLVPYRIIPIGDKAVNGWQFGLCKNPYNLSTGAEMTCLTKTMPAVNAIVGILIVLSIIGFIKQFLTKQA